MLTMSTTISRKLSSKHMIRLKRYAQHYFKRGSYYEWSVVWVLMAMS